MRTLFYPNQITRRTGTTLRADRIVRRTIGVWAVGIALAIIVTAFVSF